MLRACSVKSSNRSMRSANSENNLAILTSAKSIGSSNANETQQQPSENFVQEFYKQRAKTAGLRQNPLRKLDSAKLKKVEDWVNQTVNKDKKLIDSDYYVILLLNLLLSSLILFCRKRSTNSFRKRQKYQK